MSLFVLLLCTFCGAIEEGIILAHLKGGAGHLFKDFVSRLAFFSEGGENLVGKLLCHIIGVSVGSFYLAVGVLRVYAERGV